MDIGFYTKFDYRWGYGKNVVGDILYAETMCRELNKNNHAAIFSPEYKPTRPLDVMIYINDTPPYKSFAKRHILYLQNAYQEGSDIVLNQLRKAEYDGYALISNVLLKEHKSEGFDGIYLPFGVNTSAFNPGIKEQRFQHEVSYIGNNIKGEARTKKYLLPACDFDFGLYGNWNHGIRERLFGNIPEYRKALARCCKGYIDQEDVPSLYRSSKININVTHEDNLRWGVITSRVWEVLACRGFLITDTNANTETLLVGKAIQTSGGSDLTEKIQRYLLDEKARERIADAGYNHVVKNETIAQRMEELTHYLESVC